MNPQPFVIHGVTCFVLSDGPHLHRVLRWSTGAEVARARRLLLAIARAAVILHEPGPRA